jgi:hypothetical protein
MGSTGTEEGAFYAAAFFFSSFCILRSCRPS